MQIWPFKPRQEMIETLEWSTDILQAKSAEQRIARRTAPRRIFTIPHILTDYEYSSAQALIRGSQGDEGFMVPDWGQPTNLGALIPESQTVLNVDLSDVDIGDTALIWESNSSFEQVSITADSNGLILTDVQNNYTSAKLLPLWPAETSDGLNNSRLGANFNSASISFLVSENNDLGASSYTQYRSLDVVPDCPVITGNAEEAFSYPLSILDNQQSAVDYLRERDVMRAGFNMVWRLTTRANQWTVRRWLHSRRGRQKAFWLSSQGKDFEPAGSIASGTTVTVYSFEGIGNLTTLDIDITTHAGDSYYRRVSSQSAGTPVSGRSTIDFTVDSSLPAISIDDIKRISLLRCSRFASDRAELRHEASAGIFIQMPCVEIVEP